MPPTATHAGNTPTTTPFATAQAATPTPEQFSGKVDVGGYKLMLRCLGTGTPTVVYVSGLGDSGVVWAEASPFRPSPWRDVAKVTRSCIYDRAGTGESDRPPGSAPRTAQDNADELYNLLQHADIPGPYVLVGHSYGGFIARLFAARHPTLVSGVVLVDATHPDEMRRLGELRSLLPTATPDECVQLKELRQLDDPLRNPERVDLLASAQQVEASGSLNDRPLVVLSAGMPPLFHACIPSVFVERVIRMWEETQADLARLSTQSSHIVAEKSRYAIQIDEPELVIDAVHKVVHAARGRR